MDTDDVLMKFFILDTIWSSDDFCKFVVNYLKKGKQEAEEPYLLPNCLNYLSKPPHHSANVGNALFPTRDAVTPVPNSGPFCISVSCTGLL